MKTFSQIKTQLDESLSKDIRGLMEDIDGASFRGIGGPSNFGRGGYNDPHHLSGRGQLLDVLIRKISQLGVENDELAQEVAEKIGLDLGDSGGVQKLLKMLKCHGLGLAAGDLPSEDAKREVLRVAAEIAQHDFEKMEERPYAPEASELKRAPREARTPPNQTSNAIADPLGYSNEDNLKVNEAAIYERMQAIRDQYGLTENVLQLIEDKTDRELKKGLAEFIKDFRVANGRGGSRTIASELRTVINQIVAAKGLDSQRITAMMNEETFGEVIRISLGEDVTPALRKIVANKTAAQVKFDDGKRATIDLFTASALVSVHDNLNKKNQEKFRQGLSKNKGSFLFWVNFAMKQTSGSFKADPGRLK